MPEKRLRTEAWRDYMDLFNRSRNWPLDHYYAEGYEQIII